MIIIPEIETVVILVPRTGSGTLWRAAKARYPQTMFPYRHMEADGVPLGYDRWRRIGVLRHPVDRLWSLYNFLKTFRVSVDDAANAAENAAVARPFDDWVVNNTKLFAPAYDGKALPSIRGGPSSSYMPWFAQRHPIPENRKSQFHYLRPDLGTEIRHFEGLHGLLRELDLWNHFDSDPKTVHSGKGGPTPPLHGEALNHVMSTFKWDLKFGGYEVNAPLKVAA